MLWPQLDEYRAAVQNPCFCFSDTDIKNGIVKTNKIGLPNVSSGNFACVYEIQSDKRWAVRMFNREVTDQQYRYNQISAHLSAVLPSYMVHFQFIPQGIMINGKWYPIVKMEWVEGKTLTRWVWENQYNRQELQRMAARWRAMIGALFGLDVAHSDLQQGNVFITLSGDIKLVDYDCMFVPVMRGQQSPELGHPNWNHPMRLAGHFDSYVDQFAGLVGYLSLLAVTVDPSLLNTYCNDDNIIFTKSDFETPDNSPVFQELRKSADPIVSKLTNDLANWCKQSIDYTSLEKLCCSGSIPSGRAVVTPISIIKEQNKLWDKIQNIFKYYFQLPRQRSKAKALFIILIAITMCYGVFNYFHSKPSTIKTEQQDVETALKWINAKSPEFLKVKKAVEILKKNMNHPEAAGALSKATAIYMNWGNNAANAEEAKKCYEAALKCDQGNRREEIQQKLSEIGSETI